MVSSNQCVSSMCSQLAHTQGRGKYKEKYSGGTVYNDKESGLLFSSNQVSLKANKTLCGKAWFEHFAETCDVNITAYREYNKMFKGNSYQDDLENKNKIISFSGVGAHYQNGVAKRSIRTVSDLP